MIDIVVNMNFYMYIIILSMDNKLVIGFIFVDFFVIVCIILYIYVLSECCKCFIIVYCKI